MPEAYLPLVVSVIGAGIMSYVGVRVALADIKGEIKRLEAIIRGVEAVQHQTNVDIDRRLHRLEDSYFPQRRGRNLSGGSE